MTTPAIRTSDQTLRAQQWARLRELTSTFTACLERVQALRLNVHALKTALAWEWQFPDLDTEVARILKKRITSRVEALQVATNNLSSIQSELEDLQTALNDNYEGDSHEPM